jgi:Rrf2 family iron-sulfur cluster assembly transcriptional regulator
VKITAQEEYGLRCLMRLATAEPESLTLPEISAMEGLSVPYVAKLMAALRDAGLITSVRGRSGGYRLAKSPDDIGLGSLLLMLGEPLYDDPGYCDRHPGVLEDGCVHKGGCTLKTLWQTLETWIRGSLDQITLADLIRNKGDLSDFLRGRLTSAGDDMPVMVSLPVLK